MNGKMLIFIPTYNEAENVPKMYQKLRELYPDMDILFLDDNSPDGTGAIIKKLQIKDFKLHLIERTGKLGIGSAHQEGIKYAYKNNYDYLLTMDCDFTHPPEEIKNFKEKINDYNVVVGSRYLKEDSLKEWNMLRKFLTKTGHFLTKLFLKMDYDATGAFRMYNLKKIPRELFSIVSSKGYSFFYESLYIIFLNKHSIHEVPIDLPARTYGHSKMQFKDAWQSLKFLFTLFLTTLVNKEKLEVFVTEKKIHVDSDLKDDQGWEEYWADQKTSSRLIYDVIAAFYRKFIIKRNLNRFIFNNFSENSCILHAGAGSGQVDTQLHEKVKITALDISQNALRFYSRVNKDRADLLHGSIFKIPLENNSMDGVYNLGVMEHFWPEEIDKILEEFHRILRPGGKIVLFWPPEFGLSVVFFKVLTFVYKNLLGKKDVKFHPDEVTRVSSRKQVESFLNKQNFKLIDYSFGCKDVFTYSVVVGQK